MATYPPNFVSKNAKIEKINDEWGKYEDSNNNFSFELPWADGVKLDTSKTRIEYPQPLSNNHINYTPIISVVHMVTSKKQNFEQFIVSDYNLNNSHRANLIKNVSEAEYKKYMPYKNNITVYINRRRLNLIQIRTSTF